MSEKLPDWERELLEREAMLAEVDPRLAGFLRALDQRVRDLEYDLQERRSAEMGDDL